MSKKKAKSGKQLPISAHPAFPAVVALWFAALLGLGCLVVPVVLFESLFSATGIASVVPAAAAPLGPTARILIALVAALGGAGVGLYLARKVAASSGTAKAPRKREFAASEAEPAEAPKRPISAREELGSDSLDEPVTDESEMAVQAPAPMPGRRRALSVTDENERSEYLDSVPLPGGDVSIDDDHFDRFRRQDDALDLHEFAADEDEHEHEREEQELLRTLSLARNAVTDASPDTAAPDHAAPEAAVTEPAAPRPFDAQQQAKTPPSFGTKAVADAPRPFEASEHGEPDSGPSVDGPAASNPIESLQEEASAMTNNDRPEGEAAYNPLAGLAAPAGEPAVAFRAPVLPEGNGDGTAQQAPAAPFANPVAASADPAPAAFAAPQPAAQAAEQPLQELGMVELVERFARALQGSGASATPMTASVAQVADTAVPAYEPASAPAPAPSFAAAPLVSPAAMPAPHFAATAESEALPVAQPAFVAPEPAPAAATASGPMVFRRQLAAEAEVDQTPASAPAQEPAAAAVPQALRPFAPSEVESDEDEEAAPLGLSLPAFSAPAAGSAAAPASIPTAFEAPSPLDAASDADSDGEDDPESEAYSSLLSMKGRFGSPQPFVRIDDDDSDVPEQPVVVFPGQDNRRAEPASDGPSRDPLATPPAASTAATFRPFDGPAPAAAPGATPAPHANAGETERALREALEKLQRMSGTG
ncbi:MAG: hypothetical protein R3D99_01900 [Altererythrobacter sp.]